MATLANYQFQVVVDWIGVAFETDRSTNFSSVSKHLPRASYVEPIEPGAAGETSRFVARFQEPKCWQEITNALATLGDWITLCGPPAVVSIEVSLDAYSKAHDTNELVPMAAHFFTALKNPVSDNARFTGLPGTVVGIVNARGVQTMLGRGRGIFIGNKNDDLAQRIYVKTRDGGEGHEVTLPPEQHRARIEIRLQGDALPNRALDDWKSFDFEDLSNWFKFRRLDAEDVSKLQRLILEWDARLGARRGMNRRKFPIGTAADIELNHKAYDALRSLTTKMRRTKPDRRDRRARIADGDSLQPIEKTKNTAPILKATLNTTSKARDATPELPVAAALTSDVDLTASCSIHPNRASASYKDGAEQSGGRQRDTDTTAQYANHNPLRSMDLDSMLDVMLRLDSGCQTRPKTVSDEGGYP